MTNGFDNFGKKMIVCLTALALLSTAMVCIITDDNSSAATTHKYKVGDTVSFTSALLYTTVYGEECPVPGCSYSMYSGPQSQAVVSGTATTEGVYFITYDSTIADVVYVVSSDLTSSTSSDPLTSFTEAGIDLPGGTYTIYMEVGSQINIAGLNPTEGNQMSEITAMDSSSYGLTCSTYLLYGTVSKAGNLTVTVSNDSQTTKDDFEWTSTLNFVFVESSTAVQTYDHKITYMDGSTTLDTQNENTTDSGTITSTIKYNPTKDGYTFKGWSMNSSGSVIHYQYGDSVDISTTGLTLYAVWEKIVTKITVTVDGQTIQMDSGKTVGDLTKPSKSGYIFHAWCSDSEHTNILSDDTVLTDGMTVYSWLMLSPFENVSISYKDGSNTLDRQYEPRNGDDPVDAIIQYVATKDGYTFKGWSLDSEATSVDYQYGDTVTITGTNLDLYAVWEVNTTPVTYYDHKITYMDQGQVLHTQNLPTTDGGSVDMIINNSPTKNGYTFKGWSVSNDSESAEYQNGMTVPVPVSGLTLYAVWEKITPVFEKITITVDGKSVQIEEGVKVSHIGKPAKDGYVFIGWYSDEKLTKAVADETILTEGMTLYSKFSQKTEENLGVIVLSIMTLMVGLGMMYAGYRYGYPIVLILGIIVVALSGLSIGLEKSGSDLVTWFRDLFNGGRI